MPDAGYAFAGWYDGKGALVSEEARYAQPVTADVTLSARFVPEGKPGPGPAPEPRPEPEPTPTPAPVSLPQPQPAGAEAAAEARALAPTGDATWSLAGIVAAAAVAAACALALCGAFRRRTAQVRAVPGNAGTGKNFS